MIKEGSIDYRVKGTFEYVVEECVKIKAMGYRIVKVKAKRNWPFFWKQIWSVKLRKDVIIDIGLIIDTPIDELK